MICTRLPPLPQLAPTVCFDSLSFCRSAYITSSPIQWSALVFHWQEISLVCFSLQLLTHFPHWYSVMGRGMMEGFSLGAGMCTSVRVSTCREGRPLQLLKMDKKAHTYCWKLEFGRKRNYKDEMAVFCPASQPQ